MTKLEFLQALPLFDGIAQTELNTIAQRMFEKKLTRGEMAFTEGDASGVLFFVAEGVVKLFKTSIDGKEQNISFVRPNELFNIVSMFDEEPLPVNAQALSAVSLYCLTSDDFNSILHNCPKLAHNIHRLLVQRIRSLLSLVEDLSFRSVTSRVAKILLEHISDPTKPTPRLTQREMAAMAGTAREVVARSLKYLENAHLIEIRQRQIAIRNRKGIEQLIEMGI